MRDRSHDEAMIERFRANPDYAATLVNSILEDGDDQGELPIILGLIAAAFGTSSDEQQTALDVGRLAETFRAMGLRLSVAPVPAKPRRRTGTARRNSQKRTVRTQRPAVKAVHI